MGLQNVTRLSISPLLSNNVINLFIALCTFFTQSFKMILELQKCEALHRVLSTHMPPGGPPTPDIRLTNPSLPGSLETGCCPKFAGLNGVCPRDGALVEERSAIFKVKLSNMARAAYSPQSHQQTPELDYSNAHASSMALQNSASLGFPLNPCNRSLISSLELA